MSTLRSLLFAALLCSLGLAAAEENPVKNIKPIESAQQKVGDSLHQTADGMREVLDELKWNIGVELQARENVEKSGVKLDDISTKSVPKAVQSLQDSRLNVVPLKEGLKQGMQNQDEVIRQLQDLLKQIQRDISPLLSEKL